MNMLRENEYLRERMAQREHDKIDRVTEKIQEKADSLSKYKDFLHNCYPPAAYPVPYYTPRIEKTTKIIEKDSCRPSCHTSCNCTSFCHCDDSSYIYLLPPINSRNSRGGSRRLKRNTSCKPRIDFEHL
jgi:hypothetical protein